MYAGIELPWSIEPDGQQPMLVGRIQAAPGFAGWVQADSNYAAFANGKVATLGGPGSMAVSQPLVGNRGAFVEDAVPGGYSALALVSAQTTRYPLSAGVIDTTKPFTLMTLIKPTLPGPSTKICLGRFSSSSVRAALTCPANATNKMNFLYGAATIEYPVVYGEWNAIWISWDGSKLKARSNGVRSVDVNAAADTAVVPFVIGGPASGTLFWDGLFSELICFDRDMFDSANEAAFKDVISYMANVYGITA